MHSDLTFITNESGGSLRNRLHTLFDPATRFFDCLVGYFYLSGFHLMAPALARAEKIRILVGLKTDAQTLHLVTAAQESLPFASQARIKEAVPAQLQTEFAATDDSAGVETGVRQFLAWCQSGKLEIKVYPTRKVHAKVYIMTFAAGDRDAGRVITGSSNFSRSGLEGNLEFNVELKNRADYEFALHKFNELWAEAVNVTPEYVQTIDTASPFALFSPYEIYLKLLYEHFRRELSQAAELEAAYAPDSFKKLQYQTEAVLHAKRIVEELGGVFVADVVGLGKTYMSALLAQSLGGRSLVIAPPALLDENNPGSWRAVFRDFGLPFKAESLGKLEALRKYLATHDPQAEKFRTVFVDEAHRFRNEANQTYEKLAEICRGRRVVLVSATPLNNAPGDILSQIKLFQNGKNSTVPGVKNLEGFFGHLERRLKSLDRQQDRAEYFRTVRENAQEIREKVLQHLMVRRTRTEIATYYADDLARQQITFPEVVAPVPLFYELNEREDAIFNRTMERVASQLTYARYRPLTYYEGPAVKEFEKTGQRNLAKFMKILLVKRLESSFHAFRLSLSRFIRSCEDFILAYHAGAVYVSKKDTAQIFAHLESGETEKIEELLHQERATRFEAAHFSAAFIRDLEHDLAILNAISADWDTLARDPKWHKLSAALSGGDGLARGKVILFTESQETAVYLVERMRGELGEKALLFTGASRPAERETVLRNFDAKAAQPLDDYRILVTTDTLAEGVNLHRANQVINYDIPWNPTRMIQRVGRVNRINTAFARIHTYNFFPSRQGNDVIKLQEAAEAKIQAFIEMLGADARLLTENEEIKSHDLFQRLLAQTTLTGEDAAAESELEYLQIIRTVRDTQPELFARIKRLPRKARAVKSQNDAPPALLTYFRQGPVEKFFIAAADGSATREVDFLTAAKFAQCAATAQAKRPVSDDFYELLGRNKESLARAVAEEQETEAIPVKSQDTARKIAARLRAKEIRRYAGFTEDDEELLARVGQMLADGALPRQTQKKVWAGIKDVLDPLQIVRVLRREVAAGLFRETQAEPSEKPRPAREVILSVYRQSEL